MAKKKLNSKMVANINMYKRVFGSEEGQLVLWDIMKITGFMEPNHVPGDPYTSTFHEGQRSVACTILNRMKYDLNKIDKLIDIGATYEDSFIEYNQAGSGD